MDNKLLTKIQQLKTIFLIKFNLQDFSNIFFYIFFWAPQFSGVFKRRVEMRYYLGVRNCEHYSKGENCYGWCRRSTEWYTIYVVD